MLNQLKEVLFPPHSSVSVHHNRRLLTAHDADSDPPSRANSQASLALFVSLVENTRIKYRLSTATEATGGVSLAF